MYIQVDVCQCYNLFCPQTVDFSQIFNLDDGIQILPPSYFTPERFDRLATVNPQSLAFSVLVVYQTPQFVA